MVIFRILSGIWQFLEKYCLEFLRIIPGNIRNSVYSGYNPEYKFYLVFCLHSFYTYNLNATVTLRRKLGTLQIKDTCDNVEEYKINSG